MEINWKELLTLASVMFVFIGMAWNDGVDRAAAYIVSSTNWNDLLGAAGSLMQLKSHAHGGTTGEGSQSLGPLVQEDFTDATAPAAPGAGKTRLYAVSGLPRYRAGASGTDSFIAAQGNLGSDVIGRGVVASRPAASISGRLYVSSDETPNVIYRDNGASWDAIGFKDPTTTRGDLLVRTASGLTRLAIGGSGTVVTSNGTDVSWGAFVLTYSENVLGADVLFGTSNTYVDGPSLTLTAGTYLLTGQVTVLESGANYVTAKLTNGTTVEASGEAGTNVVGGTNYWTIPLSGVVVLAGSETWKISAASTTSSGQIMAAVSANGAGNNASRLSAVRIA